MINFIFLGFCRSSISKIHLKMTTVTKMNVIPVNQNATTDTTSTSTTTTKLTKNGNHSWPWFHGKITRDEAERLLKPTESKDGLFLVRESTNFPGDYTLCVCFQGKVEHYRVLVKDDLKIRMLGMYVKI